MKSLKLIIVTLLVSFLTFSCNKKINHHTRKAKEEEKRKYSSYDCPSIDTQYKRMGKEDKENLGRRKYSFKKALPSANKRETYSGKKE